MAIADLRPHIFLDWRAPDWRSEFAPIRFDRLFGTVEFDHISIGSPTTLAALGFYNFDDMAMAAMKAVVESALGGDVDSHTVTDVVQGVRTSDIVPQSMLWPQSGHTVVS